MGTSYLGNLHMQKDVFSKSSVLSSRQLQPMEIHMLFTELPPSVRVRTVPVFDAVGIAQALIEAMGPRFQEFTHWMPATGHCASVRVLLAAPHPDAVPIRRVTSPKDVAEELCTQFLPIARFPVQGSRLERVWEIRRTLFDDREAAVVIAGWM